MGMSSDTLIKIDHVMEQAILDKVFPGGVVTVLKNGVIVYQKAYGRHQYEMDATPYQVDDIFDLASLTKVIATTTSIMHLVDQGTLDLDEKVSSYIPEFGTPSKNDITIRDLLLHESGLPAYRNYIDHITHSDSLLMAVSKEELVHSRGQRYVYSDLGFILLAQIIEKISGISFQDYADRHIFSALQMSETMFNPKNNSTDFIKRIPPTEIDTSFRKRVIQAEVHDERAWLLGGVAGHAGLFSTSTDIAIWAGMLMDYGRYNDLTIIDSALVSTFIRRQSTLANRGLGFDMKSDAGFSSAGTLMSASTFGHTGFTGTSVWMDPERGVALIVLTNRTWPYRSSSAGIGRVRASLADLTVNAIK
jgi:CubicO group peptidase (beta-lactamase class C family)